MPLVEFSRSYATLLGYIIKVGNQNVGIIAETYEHIFREHLFDGVVDSSRACRFTISWGKITLTSIN
jgi:hypothetical protein